MINNKQFEDIKKFSLKLKKKILYMALHAGSASAHIGGALSISDILSVLFKHKIKDFKSKKRHRLILSKGHACLALYSALNLVNIINDKMILTFEKDNSDLAGHPVKNNKIGIDFSTGSLGMGLSIGIGLAISSKKKNLGNNVYVIMGDGECNEGSVWEAVMSASKFKLDNLFLIIDRNNYQQTGPSKEIMNMANLKYKFKSFGWEAEIIEGHDIKKISKYFDKKSILNKPKVLIANTVKGKGISFFEGNNSWHHSILTQQTYEKALVEIK